MSRVAVYGTLKSMHGANRMMAGAAPLGAGTTVPAYRMTDVGYPMITPDEEGHKIRV